MIKRELMCVLVASCLWTSQSRADWFRLRQLPDFESAVACDAAEVPLETICDTEGLCEGLEACEAEPLVAPAVAEPLVAATAAAPLYAATAGYYTPCVNQWTVAADVMFLRRSDADQFALITHQETGETLLDVENLEFNHNAAVRYQLIRETSSCWGFDIGYFGIDSWTSTGNGGGPVSPVLHGPGIDFQSTQHGTIFRGEYGTDLYSAEFNIRRRVHEWVTIVAGFRWIELRDELRTLTIAPQVEEFFTIDTNNHMYGFQLGADTRLFDVGRRFDIDAVFRAGIMYNNCDQNTWAPVLTPFTPDVADQITAREDHTAFVGEVGIRGSLRVFRGLYATGGYAFMLMDGLALAPDQIAHTDLVAPARARLDTGGTLYFHGATVGLAGRF